MVAYMADYYDRQLRELPPKTQIGNKMRKVKDEMFLGRRCRKILLAKRRKQMTHDRKGDQRNLIFTHPTFEDIASQESA